MSPPTWLTDSLAGVMLMTSAYCLARLVAARAWKRVLHRDTNIAHTADGVAMAGMLVAGFRTLPTGAWEVVFAGLGLWFAGRGARLLLRTGWTAARAGHDLSHFGSHLAMSAGMFYMFVESSPSASASDGTTMAMGGGATSNLSLLTLLLVLVLFVSAVWHADGLTRYTTRPLAVAVGAGTPPSSMAGAGFHRGGSDDDEAVGEGTMRASDEQQQEQQQANVLAPRLEMACHIALCVAMGYMLVLLF